MNCLKPDNVVQLGSAIQGAAPKELEEKAVIPRFRTLTLEGAGQTTILVARTGDAPAMDMSQSHYHMILRSFVLQTPPLETPRMVRGYRRWWQHGASVGILMARSGRSSSGKHDFHNVIVRGNYRSACVVTRDDNKPWDERQGGTVR